MSYTVKSITDDSVEIWDGVSNVDPDWPGERHTMTVFVGAPHQFMVGDVVSLALRLVARITQPGEEVVPIEPEVHARDDWDKFQELMYSPQREALIEQTQDVAASWRGTAQQWLDMSREDRQVFDQHG
jgi:hypothetical protein